jgi:hypothetical protein
MGREEGGKMKQINWQTIATRVRELFPNVVQVAYYSRDRWIIVFAEEPENFLNTFHPLTSLIRKEKLAMPLIVSDKFIRSSLDSYPLEFLDIQSGYSNLYAAEDVIAGLQFDSEDIRLQIERDLKSKWLLTRLAVLQYSQQKHLLFNILKESFTALVPVFKGFCRLSGNSVPDDTGSLLDAMEEILHGELRAFRYIADQKKAPSKELIGNLFSDYMRALELCIDKIDCWKLS